MLATAALLNGRPTVNRELFIRAVRMGDRPEQALPLWLACLQAGDAMAHFGLGCCLHHLGRHHDAYRHLRHYTEIAPAGSWNWCWLGKAAEAIGEIGEARRAYERAIHIERFEEGEETDAPELLERLDERRAA